MANITLSIDKKTVSCPSGTSLLEAAEQNGIKIPKLCHHPDLEPFGACRLCLVEDENTGRLMASCVTPAAQNMAIRTDSERIRKHRRNIVRLMIAEHPESCVVCSKGNRCRLRQIAAQLGLGETNLYAMPHPKPLEQANPFIIRDLSKCVLCGKCIRADHELVAVGAIDYNLRGFKSRPTTVYDRGLEQSSCTFCGTCVSMCPTGALSVKNHWYVGTPERESFSICGFCGVGCSLLMGTAGDRVIEVNPAHLPGTVNGATVCVRGHFAHDFLNSPQRLTVPLVRKSKDRGQEPPAPASWDEALETVATRLLEIKRKYGPQSVGFMGSSKCTNEENYLFQKIARVFFETNNVDNGGCLSGRSLLSLLDEKTGGRFGRRPLSELEKAEIIFVLGANPTQSTPVAGYYLKRAVRKGVPLMMADPRRTELASFSALWLGLVPGSDAELINGLAALLYGKKGQDSSFIDQYTQGFDSYRKFLSSLDLKKVCMKTGLDLGSLEKAAELLKGKKIAWVTGHGILQQRHGMQSLEALLNLSLMTGSFGSEGAGFYAPARENNEVGAVDMGAAPDALPGKKLLRDAAARKQWERAWQVKISPDPGLTMVRMIEEAEKGNLKALFILGENPLRSLPQPQRVQKALEKIELLVVQDILLGETAAMADVVLPGAAFSEKGGSFTNMEGRVQFFEPAAPPPGEARPDWEILSRLAQKWERSGQCQGLEQLQGEIRKQIPAYGQTDAGGPAGGLSAGGGAKAVLLFSPAAALPEDRPDEAYPFTAILGSVRFHLGSGTRTSRSDRIREFGIYGAIEICPQDAEKLNVGEGDIVKVVSPHGAMQRQVRLEKTLNSGLIFVPIAFNGNDAGNLIDLTPPDKPASSGWKTCRAAIEKVSEKPSS